MGGRWAESRLATCVVSTSAGGGQWMPWPRLGTAMVDIFMGLGLVES